MEKEDPAIVTKSLANDYDDFIAKLRFDQSNVPITKLHNVDGSSKVTDTLESVGLDIEYEWRPPRCSTCSIFDHTNDKCPKLHKVVSTKYDGNEGFVEVKRKKNKAKAQVPKLVDGVRLTKPPPKLHYMRVEKANFLKRINNNLMLSKL
ncbi:hypothetical protein Tco_0742545, partial [Tanacetum coccineum]